MMLHQMSGHISETGFRRRGWLDVVRGVALFVFAFAHLQDLVPALLPASLILVAVVYLPDLQFYKRINVELVLSSCFAAYILALIFVNGYFADGTAVDLVKKSPRLVYVFGVAALFACIRPTVRLEPLLVRSMLLASGIISIASLYSFFVNRVAVGDTYLTSGEFIIGLMGAKNPAAACFATVFVFAVAAWLHDFEGNLPKFRFRGFLLLLGITFLAFALCKSRGWLVGVVPMFAIVAVRIVVRAPRRLGTIALVTAVVVAGGVAATLARSSSQAENNVSIRKRLWVRAANLISQSPIIGIGPGTFEQQHVRMHVIVPNIVSLRRSGHDVKSPEFDDPNGGAHPHNSYLQTVLEFGFVGAAFYAALAAQIACRAVYAVRIRTHSPGVVDVVRQHAIFHSTAIMLVSVVLMVAGVSEGYTFIGPMQIVYFGVSAGRLVAMTEFLRAAEKSRNPTSHGV